MPTQERGVTQASSSAGVACQHSIHPQSLEMAATFVGGRRPIFLQSLASGAYRLTDASFGIFGHKHFATGSAFHQTKGPGAWQRSFLLETTNPTLCTESPCWRSTGSPTVYENCGIYAEVPSDKELGTFFLPTEEALLAWLEDTLDIDCRAAQEAIIRLIAGEIVFLQERFTRKCQVAAGFNFHPLL